MTKPSDNTSESKAVERLINWGATTPAPSPQQEQEGALRASYQRGFRAGYAAAQQQPAEKIEKAYAQGLFEGAIKK